MRNLTDIPTERYKKNVPKPPFIYEEGERVQYGAWKYARILEVFEDGLYYKVYKETPDIQYGVHKGEKKETVYLFWIDLKPYKSPEEIEQVEKLQEDEDIRFNYSQRHLESLFYLLYRDVGLDLNPDYQRGNVWSDEQKVSLIESIFKNIDIGKFTIIKRKYRENFDFLYEVLDGKQRIIAVTEFFEGRFTYKGKRYQDLHPFDQHHFKSYPVSYAEIEPLNNEQKYRYFLKLNTTGVPHDEEHLDKVREMWYSETE